MLRNVPGTGHCAHFSGHSEILADFGGLTQILHVHLTGHNGFT